MAGRGSPEAPRDRDFDDGDDEHSPSAAPRPATGSSPPGVSDSSLGIEIRQGSLSESDFDSSVIFRRMEESMPAEGTCDKLMKPAPIAMVVGFVIHPHRRERLAWDFMVLLLVIYSAFMEPYRAAFETQVTTWYSLTIDAIFWADIVLTFHTGYDRGFTVVMEKRAIITNYLKTWFLIDLAATLQWSFFLEMAGISIQSPLIRLLRLIKVLRLARASRLIQRLTAKWTMHTGFTDAFKFFLYVSIVAHLLACFFFLWPTLSECDENMVLSAEVDDDGIQLFPYHTELNCIDGFCTCLQGSWRQNYGLDANQGVPGSGMAPFRQYVDSLYWALTTMTTIGYGDRGPSATNPTEIRFVLFAEVFGLCFFALLMTEINNVNDVMGLSTQEFNSCKNAIVSFIRDNAPGSGPELLDETVQYLNFRATTLAGNSFSYEDERFTALSTKLKDRIQIALYKPVLKSIALFGWDEDSLAEDEELKQMFGSIDTDGGGTLDVGEIGQLMQTIGLSLPQEQVEACFEEMLLESDSEETREAVSFRDFRRWWALKKYGRPTIDRCPEPFLDQLAIGMNTFAYTRDEPMISQGSYGHYMFVLLEGSVKVLKNMPLSPSKRGERDDSNDQIISSSDREPIVGFAATLPQQSFMYVSRATSSWVVQTLDFVDVAAINHRALMKCFRLAWPAGQEQMISLANSHYGVNNRMLTTLEHEHEPVVEEEDLDNPLAELREEVEGRIEAVEVSLNSKLDAILASLESNSTADDT